MQHARVAKVANPRKDYHDSGKTGRQTASTWGIWPQSASQAQGASEGPIAAASRGFSGA